MASSSSYSLECSIQDNQDCFYYKATPLRHHHRRTMYWVRGKGGHFSHNFGITAHHMAKFSEYLSQVTGKAPAKISFPSFFRFKVFSPHLYQLHVCFVLCTTRQKSVNVSQLTGSHIYYICRSLRPLQFIMRRLILSVKE